MNLLKRLFYKPPRVITGEQILGTSGVDHPIDIPDNPFLETQEEREWRVEQNTIKQKGNSCGN